MPIAEGSKAPPFTLPDQEGVERSLEDYAGRHVVLFFYPKDDTPGCTKEACGFRDAHRELQDLGVEVLGISADDAESHRRFIEKYRLPFRLLSDADRSVMKAYGAYGEKTMYGRKSMGVIRSTVWIGPDGTVRQHWARVANAAAHPEKVLAAVASD